MIKKAILTITITAATLVALAQASKTKAKPTPAPGPVPMTTLDSASYAFGLKIAQGLKSDGVTTLNYALLTKAMDQVFNSKTFLISDAECGPAISNFLQKTRNSKFEVVESGGKKFLEENKKNPKVVALPSGLQYEVITEGTGPKPIATDEVTVNYKGTLIDGKQFDSSYDRNEPLTLALNSVIAGWTEGVQLMSVGSKYRFYVPYQLGYGERGAGQDIPPYSTLIFDIELLKIGK
ncbi:MAG: FKBP-type peptidyl-prolyl cis-trans isomerase [Bacteroidetes bacterium]|nr:FKBP-type peptidyl-prolyl cis-trans isomerase [Bacteroidota bacterium]MBU1371115.1 FKBP-type peptidyl-prolyl cis-trans isomerase [Bacteroidota bacterium]MBU1486004.1 FKBP-type peptidyl-prolyl cis-trans isomerase [Bacteroidota bacterium]MBU1761998.1 FKBP-type peptidyl-prolyl cis-trans isomerase [Bacteroidota bacterium]MBU2047004.1 FKBP-type peptidyl-prolyl cis-trans isomerase [Bacteroidota bacterium]